MVLAVTDTGGGPTKPHVETPDEDETHGRGLGLVTALASRVRVSGDDYGRTVTVEMNEDTKESEPQSSRAGRCPMRGGRRVR